MISKYYPTDYLFYLLFHSPSKFSEFIDIFCNKKFNLNYEQILDILKYKKNIIFSYQNLI